jgi:DNA-binding response OmpR family regulator
MGDTRTLDVHICTLRRKVEDHPHEAALIRTVRGVGYRFEVAREKPKRST